jgi:hypothetical protein
MPVCLLGPREANPNPNPNADPSGASSCMPGYLRIHVGLGICGTTGRLSARMCAKPAVRRFRAMPPMIPERCRPPMGLYPAELAKVCRLGRLACPVKTKAKESNRPDDNQVWLAEPLEALSRAFGAREILESGRKLCGDSPWRNKLWRTAVTSYVKLASGNPYQICLSVDLSRSWRAVSGLALRRAMAASAGGADRRSAPPARPCGSGPRRQSCYGHLTTGGIDDRIESTLPPVFRPNTVPRS